MAKESHGSSRAKAVLGGHGKSKSKGKKPHELRIRKGHSGGHIVTHHFLPDEEGQDQEPEEHVMPDQASLLQHVADNTDNQPAPQAPPPPDASAQAGAGAGAPPPPPGM